MQEIYFRVHYDSKSGLGHLSRSIKLSNELSKSFKVKIYLDHRKKLNPFKNKFYYLYKNEASYNAKKDVTLFLSKIQQPSLIIIDDYRANQIWFKAAKEKHKLILFDDFNKFPQDINLIINTKINYIDKRNIKKVYKINKKSKILLGPKYALLDKKKEFVVNKKNIFNIYFYSSEKVIFNELLNISNMLSEFFEKNNIKYNFFFSCGYQINKHDKYYSKFFKNKKFKFIFGDKISKNYKNFDLYVGSTGLNFFEMTQYNIPGLFFETSKNQQIETYCADLFDQYFLLKRDDINNSEKIYKLIIEIKNNIRNLKKNIINSKYKLDSLGAKRIKKEILNLNAN